jgi:hypothetical protein
MQDTEIFVSGVMDSGRHAIAARMQDACWWFDCAACTLDHMRNRTSTLSFRPPQLLLVTCEHRVYSCRCKDESIVVYSKDMFTCVQGSLAWMAILRYLWYSKYATRHARYKNSASTALRSAMLRRAMESGLLRGHLAKALRSVSSEQSV